MVSYEILENLATIECKYDDIQVNFMRWGQNAPKYDVRKWTKEGEPRKGFTLEKEDLQEMIMQLSDYFGVPDLMSSKENKGEEEIDFRKFVVHGDMSNCDIRNHDYEEISAILFVYVNSMTKEKVRAYHCRDCGAYYITEPDYKRIKSKGNIMCQVFSRESFEDFKNKNEFNGLNQEHLLHRIGYNVRQSDDLSDKARHIILQYAMESGLMSKREIIGHLSWLLEFPNG